MSKTTWLSIWIILAAFVFVFAALSSPALKAEETPSDAASAPGESEADQAAKEEENEKKLNEIEQINLIKTITGRLALSGDPGADGGDVVGTISDTTKSYLLKLEKPELMQALKPYNGKTISLKGKLRNKGKYLVVSAVSEPSSAGSAPDRVKRGGI